MSQKEHVDRQQPKLAIGKHDDGILLRPELKTIINFERVETGRHK